MTLQDFVIQYRYISNGVTYYLNGNNTLTVPLLGSQTFTFSYLGDQGFGLAPLHRITTRGPLQNGDSDIDFRLDPRILQIPLIIKNDSRLLPKTSNYAIRNALLQIFNPMYSATLQLLYSTWTGTIGSENNVNFLIDVKVLGGLSFDVDPVDYHVRTVVQLRADDPTWYAGNATGNPTTTYYLYSNIGGTQVITSGGNWPTFPIIRVNGPITNPTITNNTTGQSIALTATITAGNYYDIDLSYGKKTVIDNGGVNRISTVSAASNLATWSLMPGNNTIAVTGTGTTSASDLRFTHYNRYTGI